MRHIIAENGTSSSPNIVAICCSKAGADKFFVNVSATILLVLHCTSLTMRSLTSWSTKCSRVSMCRAPLRLLGFSAIAMTARESSYRCMGPSCGNPNSRMMIRKYRSSLPASLAAYHSLSAVLRDTLFYFTDFQLIGPPFIIKDIIIT
jgi:hypothetical protein